MTVFVPPGPPTRRRTFVGRRGPGVADGWRENADPAAFGPSTRRGRLRTVASTCQDRHGGGVAAQRSPVDGRADRSKTPTAPLSREPARPRTGLVPTTRGIRRWPAQASTEPRPCASEVSPAEETFRRHRLVVEQPDGYVVHVLHYGRAQGDSSK